MGLIMLILIGTVPTAYALNRTMHEQDVEPLRGGIDASADGLSALWHGAGCPPTRMRAAVDIVRTRSVTPAESLPALAALAGTIAAEGRRVSFAREGAGRDRWSTSATRCIS